VNSKLAVFITDDIHKELANIKDPTKKVELKSNLVYGGFEAGG
jgi:hypothetical protein